MARAGLAAIAQGSGANVVPRPREECVEPRAGRAETGVGASGLVPAPRAEEQEDGSLDRDGVSRIKPRKQGVSEELGLLCDFFLWLLMFQAL